MSKEMQQRGRAYGNYRYRRFQALDDALTVYFAMQNINAWVTVRDICDVMDWNAEDNSTRRRVRRICQSLERVHRIQIKNGGKGRGPYVPLFMRVLE
jgi:prophage antirepressor-like protein